MERIGVTGRSMGGGGTWSTMVYFGRQYYGALAAAKSPDSAGGEEITPAEWAAAKAFDKVTAGLPNSAASGASDLIMSAIHANVGVLQGQHDENGYQRPRGDSFFLPDDPEVLSVINSIMPEGQKLDRAELNTFYGDPENKTLRVFYNPPGGMPGSTSPKLPLWTPSRSLRPPSGIAVGSRRKISCGLSKSCSISWA